MAWKRKPKKVGSQIGDSEEICGEFLVCDDSNYNQNIRKIFSTNTSLAFIPTIENGLPDILIPYIENVRIFGKDERILHLHCGIHPRCILTCVLHSEVQQGCIIVSEVVRVNQKICLTGIEKFYLYQGETFSFDAREASIGNTKLRNSKSLPIIGHLCFFCFNLLRTL